MGLKERAEALRAAKVTGTKQCKLMRVREALGQVDQAELDSMLTEAGNSRGGFLFSSQEIANLLVESGHDLSGSTVAGHRAGRCGCRA